MKACASGLFFLLAAVLFVSCGKEPPPASGGSTAAAPSAFIIRSLTAERSGDHLHLTVTVHVKNPGTAPLTLTPPGAQLWIGKDKPAAPFIAPGLEPGIVDPGGESEAATHWWLAGSDLSGSLDLEISGARQTVKTASAFVLSSVVEGQSAPLAFPVWKAPSPQ